MARRWRNYTNVSDEWCRAIYDAVCPSGLNAHDVSIKNYGGRGARGMAYSKGSSYHSTARPFVVVAIARTDSMARCVMTEGAGYLGIALGNRREAIVAVLAHELRHLWQAKAKGKPRGMVYGAKGRMSERDADAYALQMLRRYRRGELL